MEIQQNENSTKWKFNKMKIQQNEKYKMVIQRNGNSTKWKFNEMENQQNRNSTK